MGLNVGDEKHHNVKTQAEVLPKSSIVAETALKGLVVILSRADASARAQATGDGKFLTDNGLFGPQREKENTYLCKTKEIVHCRPRHGR